MPVSRTQLLTGLALLGVFTVILFPARTAVGWFAPADVSVFGVSGTVWEGRARIIRIGNMQLRNSEWDLSILRLFTGRLAGDFKTRWSGGFMEGFGSIGVSGTVSLRDATLSMDISMLDNLMGVGNIGGQLSARLAELELMDNWPQRLVGTGEVRNLTSAMMGQGRPQTLGSIGFNFDTSTETDSEVVTGQLRDTGGPLELSGTLVLTPPGNYELKTRIKARPGAAPALLNNLSFLGAADPDGSRLFQLAGSI